MVAEREASDVAVRHARRIVGMPDKRQVVHGRGRTLLLRPVCRNDQAHVRSHLLQQ
jgi:hypothetical protein